MADSHLFLNPQRSPAPLGPAPGRAPLAFHRLLPGYAPTPLVDAPQLAASLGIGQVWVKAESQRLGLPAFKILGASWAVARVLDSQFGLDSSQCASFDEFAAQAARLRPLTFAAATDGNHGRAVARMAA